MLELYGHPFSSYTWKTLIPLYENNTPFTFRIVDPEHPENADRIRDLSPLGKFPVLIDGNRELCESSIIIEYLQCYYPGPVSFLPKDAKEALTVRQLDRYFDNYIMGSAQYIVSDFMRKPQDRDASTVASAHSMLQRSYRWLDQHLQHKIYACGDTFTLADCAAAPSLFYADWVDEISSDLMALREYRARLLARESVKQCVDDARPYRSWFPPGAPDRD